MEYDPDVHMSPTVRTREIGPAAPETPDENFATARLNLDETGLELARRTLLQPASWCGGFGTSLDCLDWCISGGVAGGPLVAALQLSFLHGGTFIENLAAAARNPGDFWLHRDCLALQGGWLECLRLLSDVRSPAYELYEWIHAEDHPAEGLTPQAKAGIAAWAARQTAEYLPVTANLSDLIAPEAKQSVRVEDAATRPGVTVAGALVYNLTRRRLAGTRQLRDGLGGHPVVLDAASPARTAGWASSIPLEQVLVAHLGRIFSLAYAARHLLLSTHHLFVVRDRNVR
ncbi:hypothetical protein JNJ66_04365 [Candidatus Saccharibacteria bacterium]|nr:hypothetical protein [Candidatus Saccharibacteria bacterium]